MSKKHHIVQLIDHLDMTISKFETETGLGTSTINKAIERNSKLGFGTVFRILQKFPFVNREWLETGEGEMLVEKTQLNNKPYREAFDMGTWGSEDARETYRGKEFIDLGNGNYLLYVPLVPHIATMGYLSGYSDSIWLEELPKHVITTTHIPFGEYRTFVARGQSMFDGTERSIVENSKVTGRVIQANLYRDSKLHLHRYQLYIIVHKDGIMIKEISNHDVEKGIITAHSWNPDKKKYPDIDIELKDVFQLLNVIKIEKDL